MSGTFLLHGVKIFKVLKSNGYTTFNSTSNFNFNKIFDCFLLHISLLQCLLAVQAWKQLTGDGVCFTVGYVFLYFRLLHLDSCAYVESFTFVFQLIVYFSLDCCWHIHYGASCCWYNYDILHIIVGSKQMSWDIAKMQLPDAKYQNCTYSVVLYIQLFCLCV